MGLDQSTFLSVVYEDIFFLTNTCLLCFDLDHSHKCKVASSCDFDLHVPDFVVDRH